VSRFASPLPRSYAELRRAVEAAVFKGRAEIEKAWIHTYHDTGRLINEHILLNKDRAGYGAHVFERLAEDTGISKRTLHECAQFHRCFPIVRALAQLTWNHYRLLCQVPSAAERKGLLAATLKQNWSSPQLEAQVRQSSARWPDAAPPTKDVTPPKLLTPRRGTAGVCKVIDSGAGLVVDLGFATYLDLPLRPGSGQADDTGLKAGAFARVDSAGRATAVEGATKADLFTYSAAVLKVVDGDTLWVKIYLRPRQWVKQKLRLRDLDCPEIATPEGKAAQRFTAALLAQATAVTVCTTKPDKYDRYLADVFVTTGDGEKFLNNELLDNGHAAIKREWEFADWQDSANR